MPLRDLWAGAQLSTTDSTSTSESDSSDVSSSSSEESSTSTAASPLLSRTWKILTVKPRYLSQILAGCKVWEVRKKNCKYRGNVALVASGGHCIPSDCLVKFCSKGDSPGAYVWTDTVQRIESAPVFTKCRCAQELFESMMLCRRSRLKSKNPRKRRCRR